MVQEELTPVYFFDLDGFVHANLFEDVNYVWEALKKINEYIKLHGKSSGYKHLGNDIYVAEDAVVEPFVNLKGPAIIGHRSEIRSGAYIRGNVIIGNNCVVRSEMKNSIMMNHSHAAHLSYIGDSIIGNHCNLGAGTILSNLRLDEGIIKVRVGEALYDTGLIKFGAILGDKTQTSCNVVLEPGTLVGRNSFLTCKYGGFLPSGKFVKATRKEGDIEIRDNRNVYK